MPVTFSSLLTDCSVALGDAAGTTFDRTDVIWPWCVEAIRVFPILRPMYKDESLVLGSTHVFDLNSDFREMISVEYPIGQTPPHYLIRKNRLDPDFYSSDEYYDVDHNYADGVGYVVYTSALLKAPVHVYLQYLANHEIATLEDDSLEEITIPDEYIEILIDYVLCRGYRERLGFYMQDPTAHMTVINQMTQLVYRAEENYRMVVEAAQKRLAFSKIGTHLAADKYDRVY